jgi:hypothetical protein
MNKIILNSNNSRRTLKRCGKRAGCARRVSGARPSGGKPAVGRAQCDLQALSTERVERRAPYINITWLITLGGGGGKIGHGC